MGSISNMFAGARARLSRLVWGAPRADVGLDTFACPDPVDPTREVGWMCRAGEDIVCDGVGQHVICTAVEDIPYGSDSAKVNEQFYWFQAPPAIGTAMLEIACQHCGGRWVSSGMHLHFRKGWR